MEPLTLSPAQKRVALGAMKGVVLADRHVDPWELRFLDARALALRK